MLMRNNISAIMAPPVNIPPSRNRWNEIIFTVIGSMRREASAIRFVMMSPILIANTRAMI